MKKNLSTMLSCVIFCMGVTENKWNDPTATTGKKTCSVINMCMTAGLPRSFNNPGFT